MKTAEAKLTKTYVLLDHMQPSAPIFVRAGKQRFRINKLPRWKPNLQYTFEDNDGMNVTIRFKLNTNTIMLKEQIDSGIPANQKFSQAERGALTFVNGIIMTKSKQAQDFLEANPHFKEFQGVNYDVSIKPSYEAYSKDAEDKEENRLIKLTYKALGRILDMELEEAQKLLIRVMEAGYVPSDDLVDVQNTLTKYMDESLENVEEILKETEDVDEGAKIEVFVGELIAAKIISFDALEDKVAEFKNNEWKPIREISSTEYELESRITMFSEFLSSKEGKPMLNSLTKKLNTSKKENGSKE